MLDARYSAPHAVGLGVQGTVLFGRCLLRDVLAGLRRQILLTTRLHSRISFKADAPCGDESSDGW